MRQERGPNEVREVNESVARPIHLSTALAQRIVDDLSPVLNENLNLMDADGFIVASRDTARVGTLHPGAREAAMTGEVVHVHESTKRPGERPGVNLPLKHRGQVIGVVGVTGPPDLVGSLASVLVLTITLLVEREAELVGESHRDAADRDVLARLVYGSRPEEALELLARRQPALPGPWILFAGMGASPVSTGVLESAAGFRRRFAESAAQAFAEEPTHAVVGSLRGVTWVLVSCGGTAEAAAPRVAGVSELVSRVAALVPGARIVHSGVCATAAALVREASNLAALSTRAELLTAHGPSAVLLTHELRLQLSVAHLPGPAARAIAAVLEGVTPAERETLRAFLASGNAADVARTGFTHRNTVLRRLQRIERRTGYDLRIPGEAAILALALAADDELAVS